MKAGSWLIVDFHTSPREVDEMDMTELHHWVSQLLSFLKERRDA